MMFARERDMMPVVAAWMASQGLLVKTETFLYIGYCDLVGAALNPEMVERRLRRRKDWRPLHRRLIAVELKLARIGEAFQQARWNLTHVEESYVAFPADIAERIASKRERWQEFFDEGIGLLAVTPELCSVAMPAGPNRQAHAPCIERQVEKFWRERRRLEAGAVALGRGR